MCWKAWKKSTNLPAGTLLNRKSFEAAASVPEYETLSQSVILSLAYAHGAGLSEDVGKLLRSAQVFLLLRHGNGADPLAGDDDLAHAIHGRCLPDWGRPFLR
jgi:hypothetical protein